MKKIELWIKSSILILTFSTVALTQNQPLQNYESAYLAQNRYPAGASALAWFPDDYEIQGVTNDGSNWFFTIVDQDKTHAILWRIPRSVPLNSNIIGKPGVKSVNYNTIPILKDEKLWHWGDPDYLRFEGVDYVLVPVNTDTPAIICFRADNLAYVNFAWLDNKIPGGGGWCAVGVDNDLYVSADDPSSVVRYDADWGKLIHSNNNSVFAYLKSYPLTQSDGTKLQMTDMQGGEFTSTGEMLYLVSGRGRCLGNGAEWTSKDGIHAIETEHWRELARSTKNSASTNYFSYDYDPTCNNCFCGIIPTGSGTDTPEGLTFWDLEDGSAPGIRGSLHVLINYYTYGGSCCDDEVTLHHFSPKVFVDVKANGGPGLLGRKDNPFKTFSAAINTYPVWDGAQIILRPGIYLTGKIVLDKRVLLNSEGGTAIIK